jgi:cytochrome c oxidase assembly protein Cox11
MMMLMIMIMVMMILMMTMMKIPLSKMFHQTNDIDSTSINNHAYVCSIINPRLLTYSLTHSPVGSS